MVQSEADRFKELYDVERHVMATDGGILVEDPYPAFAEVRAKGPVHKGSVRELLGYGPGGMNLRPEAPVYSAFSFEANDIVLRENDVFSSTFYAGFTTLMFGKSILEMVGEEHRRYRALVQPAFSPKRAQWWIDRWIASIVDEAVSGFEERGYAELNAELCARIPLQTITMSFGLSREEAFEFREGTRDGMASGMDDPAARHERTTAMLRRVIEDRRVNPQDDVITELVESEIEEDGERHLLTDDDIYGFARLILTAGSGTTWRQLGILLVGLLREPALLDAVRDDRELLRRTIDEAVRWEPTDPIFRRLVDERRRVVRRRHPRRRGRRDEPRRGQPRPRPVGRSRPLRPVPHAEVEPRIRGRTARVPRYARRGGAEMFVAMNAVLDRLPNLRFDPDAPNVRIIGLEHRGPNGIPVVFG